MNPSELDNVGELRSRFNFYLFIYLLFIYLCIMVIFVLLMGTFLFHIIHIFI